ncbi:MAG: cytochrome c3 family protein [Pirellulales bacterium]
MRYYALFLLLALLGAAAAEKPADEKAAEKPSGPPPLKLETDEPPLLLDDAPKDVEKVPMADNQHCFVCHSKYDQEEFAVVHAKADVGCVKCHGASLAHRNDENNTTPPDIIFPKEGIEANCITCHETHDAPVKKVIARWMEVYKDKDLDKVSLDKMLCTDCHGDHRMAHRTVRWDKHTRKLIINESKPNKSS